MNTTVAIAPPPGAPLWCRPVYLVATALAFVAYAAAIRVALDADLPATLLGALANTVPVILLGIAIRHVVVHRLIGRSMLTQLVVHLGMGAIYALLAYGMVLVLLGFFVGKSPDGYLIRPFNKGGLAWQTLENVTTYALIAALAHLQAMRDTLASLGAVPPAPTPGPSSDADPAPEARPSRHFVRIGDEWRPLDWDTVVCIGGADDYAEVRTTDGTHLVRVTLAEFERTLDPARYVRVHRSWLVDIQRVTHIEPAGGGCLLLHLPAGPAVKTSREGAKRVRDRVL